MVRLIRRGTYTRATDTVTMIAVMLRRQTNKHTDNRQMRTSYPYTNQFGVDLYIQHKGNDIYDKLY